MSVTGTETSTTTYVYDEVNRLTTETKGSVVTLYVYDANGNLLSEVCGQSVLGFRYNARNQLTSAAVNGVTVGVYTYNADGIRTAKLSTDGVTYFLLDGGYVVGETTASTVKATYLYGANLIRRDTGTDTAYYLYNAHGDVVDLADSTGASTKSYKYDAFGNEDDPDEDDPNPFRYCAEYFDKETGTYYLRARYYDPTTGRFTQQDTHWNPGNGVYGDVQRILFSQLIIAPYSRLISRHICRAPQILSIMQHSNNYLFCACNPLQYTDSDGTSLMVATMLTDSGTHEMPPTDSSSEKKTPQPLMVREWLPMQTVSITMSGCLNTTTPL